MIEYEISKGADKFHSLYFQQKFGKKFEIIWQ